MISFQQPNANKYWININPINYIPMMTRHYTRRNLSRTPHTRCTNWTTLRNNSVHYLRSLLLPGVFLSLLPLKLGPNTRTRQPMTPKRNSSTQPIRSPTIKHSSTACFWCNSNLSSPLNYRRKPKRINPGPTNYYYPRHLLHSPTSNRVLRNYLLYLR